MTTQQLLNAVLNPQAPEPVFRDSKLHLDVREGSLQVLLVLPDGTPESWKQLTQLKLIFQKQLPKMPREYVSRLVYDKSHRAVALARNNNLLGGIAYRLFPEGSFAEIVFCAVSAPDQVKGYGSFLMGHLKEQVKRETNGQVMHFLTYADNYAVGYFKKQGFTKNITLEREKWAGRIKDYEGGTLMQCSMLQGVDYLEWYATIWRQKLALMKSIHQRTECGRIFSGLQQKFPINNPAEIPGLVGAGWTPEMSRLAEAPRRGRLYQVLKGVLGDLKKHPAAWPFLLPVDGQEVPDYYDIITHPMDLALIEKKLEQDLYGSVADFASDVKQIVINSQTYNSPETTYYKNAVIFDSYFKERMKNKEIR